MGSLAMLPKESLKFLSCSSDGMRSQPGFEKTAVFLLFKILKHQPIIVNKA
jgi:hypothetical protein